jgi:hypothetical protein
VELIRETEAERMVLHDVAIIKSELEEGEAF